MAYATLTEFKSHLGTNVSPPGIYEQLTDRVNFSVADDAVGQDILDGADSEVNLYLAKRYKVPVDVSTDAGLAQLLKKIVLAIAAYDAWQTRPPGRDIPERVSAAKKDFSRILELIADGSLALPGASLPTASTSIGQTAEATGFGQVFTEKDIKDL